MSNVPPSLLQSVAKSFDLYGSYESGAPYGTGHINDTFAVVFDQAGTPVRYIMQRVNQNVFKNAPALMDNIRRVTEHQNRKLREAGTPRASRRALTLIHSRDGAPFVRDGDGGLWRMYLFIEGATGHDIIETPAQAEAAARAFGMFQGLLTDLPGAPLHETIPDFHHTGSRFAALQRAIEADTHNRAADVQDEIKFALEREADTSVLIEHQAAGRIPTVVTHNDTKLNNVLLDDHTGEGVCVIDLDTIMPGLALYDFGDMVRTATNSAAEDEQNLALVEMRMSIFEALARGYLSTAGLFLNQLEKELLPFAGKLLTFECGIRFLTDHLQGDSYFKIHRPNHNLDRCRNQFKLVKSIEEQLDNMQSLCQQVAVS